MHKYITKEQYNRIRSLRTSLRRQGSKIDQLPTWGKGKVIVKHLNRHLNTTKSTTRTYKTGITMLLQLNSNDVNKILYLDSRSKKNKKLTNKLIRRRRREEYEKKYRKSVDLQNKSGSLKNNEKKNKRKTKKNNKTYTNGNKNNNNNSNTNNFGNNRRSKRKNNVKKDKKYSKLKSIFSSKKSIKKIEKNKLKLIEKNKKNKKITTTSTGKGAIIMPNPKTGKDVINMGGGVNTPSTSIDNDEEIEEPYRPKSSPYIDNNGNEDESYRPKVSAFTDENGNYGDDNNGYGDYEDDIDDIFESALDRDGMREFVEIYIAAESNGSEEALQYHFPEEYEIFMENKEEILDAYYRRG